MAKVKYYYDSNTLSYRKIEYKKGRKKFNFSKNSSEQIMSIINNFN